MSSASDTVTLILPPTTPPAEPDEHHKRIAATRQYLLELQVNRESLDTEAQTILSELNAPQELPDGTVAPCVGVKTPLVDAEGFPRNDIDVYRARSLRQRLSELETDRRRIVKEMERSLQQLAAMQRSENLNQHQHQHQQLEQEQTTRLAPKPRPKYDPETGKWVVTTSIGPWKGDGTSKESPRDIQPRELSSMSSTEEHTTSNQDDRCSLAPSSSAPVVSSLLPFARIDAVADNSPAQLAGLLVDDRILSFDDINCQTEADNAQQRLQRISSSVSRGAANNERLLVVVQRRAVSLNGLLSTEIKELYLQPQPWAGRGLLGCHLVPI